MKVFITGASGYIGGSVAAHLVAAGHEVSGLARTEETAAALEKTGIASVRGTLDDATVLADAARAADAVVDAANATHRGAAEAMLAGLAGSGKAFIHTSGSSIVGTRAGGEFRPEVFDEDTPFTPSPTRADRVALDNDIRAANGVRSVVIAPSLIYGRGHGLNPDSMQVPWLIALATQERHRHPYRVRREPLGERAYRRSRHALRPGAGEGAGGQLLFRRERRELHARSLRSD